jgi:hypothetical protein
MGQRDCWLCKGCLALVGLWYLLLNVMQRPNDANEQGCNCEQAALVGAGCSRGLNGGCRAVLGTFSSPNQAGM